MAEPDYRQLLAALDTTIGNPGVGFEGIILGAAEKQWLRAVLMSAAHLSG